MHNLKTFDVLSLCGTAKFQFVAIFCILCIFCLKNFVLKVTSLFASTSQYLRRNIRREGGGGAWRPAQSAVTVGTVCEIFGLYCWHHCCSQMLGWWWCSQAWWREKTCRVSRRVGTVAHSAQLAFSNISSVFRSLCVAHRPLLAGTQRLLCHLTIHFLSNRSV